MWYSVNTLELENVTVHIAYICMLKLPRCYFAVRILLVVGQDSTLCMNCLIDGQGFFQIRLGPGQVES